MTTGAPLKISDITDKVRWSDQVYGRGSQEAPMLTFARSKRVHQKPGKQPTTYTKKPYCQRLIGSPTTSSNISPYRPPIPVNLNSSASSFRSCRSIPWKAHPGASSIRKGVPSWDIDRWPDAVMMREVFWFVDPPILREIVSSELFGAMTSNSRNRLGEPGPELYEAIKYLEVAPVLDLYRSQTAMDYLKGVIEQQQSMQVVANRRTDRAGYVYALSLREYPGLLKIGSAFDPHLRAMSMSTGIPTDFVIEDAVLFEDCRKAERDIHVVLATERHRHDREWFRCEPAHFREIALRTPGAVSA